jgi:tetraacyldisaccharide-1-P 4'-kinase
MHVSAASWFDDHHHYDPKIDFLPLLKVSQERRIEAWITTLKDWVKLRGHDIPGAGGKPAPPIWHVRIEARLRPHEQEVLKARLATLTAAGESPQPAPAV